MAKRLFKRKKKTKTMAERRREIREKYLTKTKVVRQRISSGKISKDKDPVSEMNAVINSFFEEMLHLKYEATNQEIINELRKKKLKGDIKKTTISFLERVDALSYSPTEVDKDKVLEQLDIFISLIDEVYEGMTGVRMPKKKKGGEKGGKNPAEMKKNLSAGLKVMGRLGSIAAEKIKKPFIRPQKDYLPLVMAEIAKGYEELEKGRRNKAKKSLESIAKHMELLSLDEVSQIQNEVKILTAEVNAAFADARPQFQATSSPESPTPAQAEPDIPDDAPKESPNEELQALEDFVKMALEHKIAPPAIKSKLKQNGWTENQIEQIFTKLSL